MGCLIPILWLKCISGGQKAPVGVNPHCLHYLKPGLPTVAYTTIAGLWLFRSPILLFWNYRCMHYYIWLWCAFWNLSSWACMANSLPIEPSLHSPELVISMRANCFPFPLCLLSAGLEIFTPRKLMNVMYLSYFFLIWWAGLIAHRYLSCYLPMSAHLVALC